MFLKYRERAMTLKYIFKQIPDLNYNYLQFRNENIIDIGYELACKDLLNGLKIILKYHSHEINIENKLRILTWIPLTIHPNLYFDMLPILPTKINTQIFEMDRWFKQEFGLEINNNNNNNNINRKQIVNWYTKRVYDIEKITGNVENALILCNFAVENKNILQLKSLLEILLLFHKIIYEYNVNTNISIKEFELM
eukprot:120155_1